MGYREAEHCRKGHNTARTFGAWGPSNSPSKKLLVFLSALLPESMAKACAMSSFGAKTSS